MTVDLFSGLVPLAQLALVLGVFAVIFLVAYNPAAAANLVTFLRELRRLVQSGADVGKRNAKRVVKANRSRGAESRGDRNSTPVDNV